MKVVVFRSVGYRLVVRLTEPRIAALAVALAGCSLLTDFDALGPDGGGATAPGDPQSEEASVKPQPDALGPVDAGPTEAGSDAEPDAPALPFCATVTASFCDDYEREVALGNWTELVQDRPTILGIEAFGAGRAGVVRSNVQDAGEAFIGYWKFLRNDRVAVFAWEADVSFDAFPVRSRPFVQFALLDQPQYQYITLKMSSASKGLEMYAEPRGGGSSTPFELMVKILPGQTSRMRLSIEQAAPNQQPRVQLTIDGMPSTSALLTTQEPIGRVEVRQGIGHPTGPAEDWLIRYDNTTIDLAPAAL